MEEEDDILEMQIKFKEELLRQYQRLSEKSGISPSTQEETTNEILDNLSELYKKRNK